MRILLLLFSLLLISEISHSSCFSFPISDSPDSKGNSSYDIIKDIEITGNKTTRKKIILRELLFSSGDTVKKDELEDIMKKSKENLLNTSLFNFVTITKQNIDSSSVIIRISLLERWYLWPVPIIELSFRNFNSWLKTKDLGRINYGFSLSDNNFRGRKEDLSLLVRYGYDELYNLSYFVPYINKKQTIGLGFYFGVSREHEISYTSYNNKLIYYSNFTNYPLTKFAVSAELNNRYDFYNSHIFQLDYVHYIFNDTLNILNKDFSYDNDINPQFLTLHYKYRHDFRDSKPYPLVGNYFDIDIYKLGLFFETRKPDLFYIHSTYSKYWQLSKKYYLASGFLTGFKTKKEIPYYLTSGIGYGHDNIRGFDYYVIQGQWFGIAKLNLKFVLLPTHVHDFKFIPTEKFSKIHYAFYLNLFADGGYVYDDHFFNENKLANQFLYSSGIGLDFVTYYDEVIRFEYTINKLKQTGIFINFIASI